MFLRGKSKGYYNAKNADFTFKMSKRLLFCKNNVVNVYEKSYIKGEADVVSRRVMNMLDWQQQQTFSINGMTITVISPGIIRVFQDRGYSVRSKAIAALPWEKTTVNVTRGKEVTELRTDTLVLKLDEEGHVDVYDVAGNPLAVDYRGKRAPQGLDKVDQEHRKLVAGEGHSLGAQAPQEAAITVIKQLTPTAHFYGLGDKTGYLDKRGYAYDNWNVDFSAPQLEIQPNLYKSIPVMFSLDHGHPVGLFFDNPSRSHFDFGRENPAYYYYSADEGNLDYYILGGATLKEVVANYTRLTGYTPLPQKWTLGYQQSRWGYSRSATEMMAVADGLTKHKIPCDAIHLDIDYMDGYRDFTWDQEKYPEGPRKFVAAMKRKGYRLVTIIDAGVKKDEQYSVYKEGEKHHYFIRNHDGSPYVNTVWPGDAVFPDFGNPVVRQWWGRKQRFLTDLGIAGTWNDMNEPASFNGPLPLDLECTDEDTTVPQRQVHNVYGHNMSRATYEGIKDATGLRPFVITRAAYAGTQKYSTVWTGDNRSIWPHLQWAIPQLCNLGLSGFPFCGTDIGGFASDTTPELLVRWIEAALFSPLYRNHSELGTRHQEPWAFDDQTLRIYRQYVRLRYRFIPYLYDLFAQHQKTGLPVMRPVILNYPDDERAANLNDEYMVGDDLLVAPVVVKAQRRRLVYLPAGEWVDFWNNREYAGNQDIVVDAPLERLPLFVRKNAVIPWGRVTMHVAATPDKQMRFRVFGNNGTTVHYQDNGRDFKYQKGEYNLYQVTVTAGQATVKIKHHGYAPCYQEVAVETMMGVQRFRYAGQEQYVAVKEEVENEE